MANELLLVGSIPYETAEEVFRTFGSALGKWLAYMPDGEIGDRQYWIDGIAYRVLNGHPELETIKRPAPDDGVERWRPRGRHDQFAFRVKPGVKHVRFGDPGWRLGYTRDAVNSYFIFRKLKAQGVIPDPVRFQVAIPLTVSAVTSFFPDKEDHAKIIPGFTQALRAEIAKMVEKIPPDDLAIQWDCAVEERIIEAKLGSEGMSPAVQTLAEQLLEPARELSPYLPEQVALGYHACFGTLDGWPSRQPRDLTGAVLLLNAAVAASGRRVDFVHLPTLGNDDDAFIAPLRDLRPEGARVYLGAIHHMHDSAGLRRQLHAARQYLRDFGIAAPCGFGRGPGKMAAEKPGASARDPLPQIIQDHVAAVEVLREVLKG